MATRARRRHGYRQRLIACGAIALTAAAAAVLSPLVCFGSIARWGAAGGTIYPRVLHRAGRTTRACHSPRDGADLVSGAALSKETFIQRAALRQPIPERATLQQKGGDGSVLWEARLRWNQGDEGMVRADLLETASEGAVELDVTCGAIWRVRSSSIEGLCSGDQLYMYDASPPSEAPESAERGDGGTRTMRLRGPTADGGSASWNFKLSGGFAPAECPREFDGVDFAFTVWTCRGASGICSIHEEGEDDKALVCEFGPKIIRESLQRMVPGETRRFWIPDSIEDRRFGRPIPDAFLPPGMLVVDIRLRSIEREAVFSYERSAESIAFGEARDMRPQILLPRTLGVGVQILAVWWYVSHAQRFEGAEVIQGLNGMLPP